MDGVQGSFLSWHVATEKRTAHSAERKRENGVEKES